MSTEAETIDLETVSTEMLWAEIARRSECALLARLRPHEKRHNAVECAISYSGGVAAALGLCGYANMRLLQSFSAGAPPMEEC